jgi:hypothetical protein
MDDNYLRQRTDEILRQRIALGMTGGEGFEDSYVGGKFTASEAKLARTVERYRRNPPRTEKGIKTFESAKRKLLSSLQRKKHRGVVDERMFKSLKKRSGSKARKAPVKRGRKKMPTKEKQKRHCARLKTQYRRDVCDYRVDHPRMSYASAMRHVSGKPKKKMPSGNLSTRFKYCTDQKYKNPWIFFLCRYRAKFGHLPKYQGQQGQRDLVHNASINYKQARVKRKLAKFGYGEGEGEGMYGMEDYEGVGDGLYY